jgi:hypothetical protein
MADLITNLTSLSWWGSAVVVALLVNFLSQFLYPRIAALPPKGLGIIRRKAKARQAAFEGRVQALKDAPERLLLAVASEHRHYWVAFFVMACAIFVLLTVAVLPTLQATVPPWMRAIFFFISSVLFILGTRIADKGFEIGRIIVTAMKVPKDRDVLL